MLKRDKVILLLVACAFMAIGAYISAKKYSLHAAESSVVAELFALTMPDSNGQPHALSHWKGKNLVVNFWATWCAPCVQEMPELSVLQNDAMKTNTQIIGIGLDSASNIRAFSSTLKVSYPLYVADTKGMELLRKFGNQAGGLPFTVLIDQNGQIKKTYLGRLKLEELKRDVGLR